MNETLPKARILVVDDNEAAASGLVRLLNALGCDAHPAFGPEDARTFLEANTVDLTFIDIGMPVMNGHELIALLRGEGFEAPAIALTGYGLEEDKQRAEKAGFTDHYTKPIGVKELREALARYLPAQLTN